MKYSQQLARGISSALILSVTLMSVPCATFAQTAGPDGGVPAPQPPLTAQNLPPLPPAATADPMKAQADMAAAQAQIQALQAQNAALQAQVQAAPVTQPPESAPGAPPAIQPYTPPAGAGISQAVSSQPNMPMVQTPENPFKDMATPVDPTWAPGNRCDIYTQWMLYRNESPDTEIWELRGSLFMGGYWGSTKEGALAGMGAGIIVPVIGPIIGAGFGGLFGWIHEHFFTDDTRKQQQQQEQQNRRDRISCIEQMKAVKRMTTEAPGTQSPGQYDGPGSKGAPVAPQGAPINPAGPPANPVGGGAG
jgi:hypothetical protein